MENADAVTDMRSDYLDRGFVIGFLGSVRNNDWGTEPYRAPENYSRETVAAGLDPWRGTDETPEVLPDILFIMSESLYDIASELQLSEDPLANFKAYQAQHWGGEYLSAVYGGKTASAEYEVLTGYPAADTNGHTFNTGNVIPAQMDSIPSALASYGYFTQAMHLNSGSFYDRRSVYARMGFESTLFTEELGEAPKSELQYPKDEYFFEKIIEAYENRPKDRPWFCHAITYQNHGGYGSRPEECPIEVQEALLDHEMTSATNYVNLLRLSDKNLVNLIAYFDGQERPVVIVMWGDHAPSLAPMGVGLSTTPEESVRYYTTPLLIYSNYGLEVTGIPKKLSAYRLGAAVLNLLGMDADPYYNYLASDACENITMNGLIERDGAFIEDEVLRERIEAEIWLQHYDRVFGARYGKER